MQFFLSLSSNKEMRTKQQVDLFLHFNMFFIAVTWSEGKRNHPFV